MPAEEVKRAYDEGMQRNQWGKAEERQASHILITTKPDAPEAEKQAARARADAIAAQVRKAPAKFAEIARKESQDPGSAAQGGDLGFFGRGSMVKPFEDAVFAAKKGDILGPVASEFGFHVIRVTDIKPAQVKSLADATPELEAVLKKQVAQRKYAESAEQFSNLVYEQSSSLKPAADALGLTVQALALDHQGRALRPAGAARTRRSWRRSSPTTRSRRSATPPPSKWRRSVLVAARVVEHKPSELRPLDAVRADIERKLQRDEAMKLARAEGEAKLKDLQAGKDAGVKWPAPLEVNRRKPGGPLPAVIDRAFRADAKKLPAVAGVETPMGYSLVRVTKVTEPEKIDNAQRQALGSQLQQAVAMQELEATLSGVRSRVGVTVKQGALDVKDPNAAAPQQAPKDDRPRPRSKL